MSSRQTKDGRAPARVVRAVRAVRPARVDPDAAMPIATHWELLPARVASPEEAAERSRGLVRRRALLAAGVAMVPIPGVDWVTDVGILVDLLPRINAEFGLTPAQIERLAPDRRLVVYKVLSAGSGMLVGKMVTRELVLRLLKMVGVRLTTQQAAKFVPIAGQVVSAALTYSALRYVCEQHIRQCVAVTRQLALEAPVTEVVG